MPLNILLNEYPSQAIAQFLRSGDRGVVETTDGKVYSFDIARPKGQRFKEEQMGFHLGMWLQPALCGQPHFWPAGDYPFIVLEARLELLARTHAAIRVFLMSLDTDFSVEERQGFARRATHMFKEDAVSALAEPALVQNQMPSEFDVTHGPKDGKAGEILQKMICTWR